MGGGRGDGGQRRILGQIRGGRLPVVDSGGHGDWRRLSGSRERRRRRAGKDEVRLVRGVGGRVGREHMHRVGVAVCVWVWVRVRQCEGGLGDGAPSGRGCGLRVEQCKLWVRG